VGQRIAISTKTLLSLSVFLGFCLLSLTELKVFEAWSQVTYLWDSGQPLLYFIGHFHFTRYLTSYPGLMFEESYPGIGFSIYMSIFVTLNTLLFRQIHNAITGYPPSLFVYIIFLLIHLFMNGRGAIGWSGWLLCLSLHCKFSNSDQTGSFLTVGNSSMFFFSTLFSSVSSGVFIVVFMSNILLIARLLRSSALSHKLKFKHLVSILFANVIVGCSIYFATFYLLDALQKILLFYGSYSSVVMHGLGLLAIYYDLATALIIIVIMAIIFILLWVILKREVPSVIWLLFITSMAGGVFGFTTLTLTIPLFLIFFSVLLRLTLTASRCT
jgi:hypothetical protein